jgi:hypothetical protein
LANCECLELLCPQPHVFEDRVMKIDRVDIGSKVYLGPRSAVLYSAVARDYLGPEAARKLAARSEGERDAAFAHAWSEHEARLKCLGLQLAEWCDERAVAL